MSRRGDRERLADMLDAIQRATSYVAGISYEDFLVDAKTQDATIRALEVLGEASKEISTDLKTRFPDIPWKRIAGQRDKLIHNYFGINFDIVWESITLDLPALESQVILSKHIIQTQFCL
jgi:uncharacterized protein with HEPN domain